MKDLAYRFVPVVSILPTASVSLAGVVLRLSTDNKPYWCDGNVWVDLTQSGGNDTRLTTTSLAADVSNSTVTLSDVTPHHRMAALAKIPAIGGSKAQRQSQKVRAEHIKAINSSETDGQVG